MGNGDWYRLSIEGHYALESITVANVLWFQQTSVSPVGGESQILADDFKNNVIDGIGQTPRNWQTFDFVYDLIRCQKMGFTFEAPASSAFGPPVQLGSGGEQLNGIPSCCALVYKLSTGSAGRRHRGRLYFGGIAGYKVLGTVAATADHGRWSTGLITDWNAYMARILARYDGVTVFHGGSGFTARWGIFSRAIGGSSPPFNVAGFQPVTAYSTDGIIRIQRRREFGVGP